MTRKEIEPLYVEEPNCFETDREEQWYKVGLKEGLAAADQCPALTPAAATFKALQEIQSDGVPAMKAAIMSQGKGVENET